MPCPYEDVSVAWRVQADLIADAADGAGERPILARVDFAADSWCRRRRRWSWCRSAGARPVRRWRCALLVGRRGASEFPTGQIPWDSIRSAVTLHGVGDRSSTRRKTLTKRLPRRRTARIRAASSAKATGWRDNRRRQPPQVLWQSHSW